jgi:hypothetical protein
MDKVSNKVINKLRDKYEIPEDDVELLQDLLQCSALGVKSSDIAVMCGHHASDWDFVHDLRKRVRIEKDIDTEVIRPKNSNYFLIITVGNLPYLEYARACRRKVKARKIQEPEKVRVEREKRAEEKAQERQNELAEKRKKDVNIFYEFKATLEGRTQFSYRDIMVWSTFTRTYARKLTEKWEELGLVRELERGTGGRLSKNVFIVMS